MFDVGCIHQGEGVTYDTKTSRLRGFTLLELLIGIAVLAILLAVAAPSFRATIQNNRLTTQANNFMTALQLARSEALKRSEPVSVCASDTSAGTPSCGSDWTQGWIAFVDDEAPGTSSASYSSGNLIRQWAAPDGGTTIADSGHVFVRYLPGGQIDPVNFSSGTSVATIELRIPDCTRDSARDIEISRTGRASVERVSCP